MADIIPIGIDKTTGRPTAVNDGDAIVSPDGTALGGGGAAAPAASISMNANKTNFFPNLAWTTVTPWDIEDFDNDTMVDLGANADRITITTAGKYLVTIGIAFEQNATGIRSIAILLSNSSDTFIDEQLHYFAGTNTYQTASVMFDCAATDYITMKGLQDSGGALDLRGMLFNAFAPPGTAVKMSVHKVSD